MVHSDGRLMVGHLFSPMPRKPLTPMRNGDSVPPCGHDQSNVFDVHRHGQVIYIFMPLSETHEDFPRYPTQSSQKFLNRSAESSV